MKMLTKEYKNIKCDLTRGLLAKEKFIPTKYFYDSKGSTLFQKIMDLPEYYLTRAETNVFKIHKENIISLFGDNFDLIELGAGDGKKTEILIQSLFLKEKSFTYMPIDISSRALSNLSDLFYNKFPEIDMIEKQGDYFDVMDQIKLLRKRRKIVLFLGSNLGNYTWDEAISFLKDVASNINKGDLLLLGLDLKKNPETILKAYNDETGITKEFNINLLNRLNEEIGTDFDQNNFIHAPFYNPISGTAYSCLVSTCDQKVYAEKVNEVINLYAWEAIHTEISQKYDQPMIQDLAEESGYKIIQNFRDNDNLFVDTLWMKK